MSTGVLSMLSRIYANVNVCSAHGNICDVYLLTDRMVLRVLLQIIIGFNLMQENFNLKHIADAPLDRPDPQSTCDKERLLGLRKRCKKLRLRLTQRSVL